MKPIQEHELDLSSNQLLYEAIKISLRTVKELKYKSLSLFIGKELRKILNIDNKVAFGIDDDRENYVYVLVFDGEPDGTVSVISSSDGETYEKTLTLE